MAKTKDLQSIQAFGIKVPAVLALPEELEGRFTRDEWKVFGHFCNKNPELPCMTEPTYLKNVAKCIKATANGKLDDVIKEPLKMTSHPLYKQWQKYYQNIKDEKALLRKDPKWSAANKEHNEGMKKLYGFAIVDGREEPLQSYMLEPEGIYAGRPGSPDNGMWKEATVLSDVVVNTNSESLPVLINPDDTTEAYDWRVIWNPTYHYVAKYPVIVGIPGQKPFSKTMKKVMFSAQSSIKKEGQEIKYANADNLMKQSADLIQKLLKELKTNPTPTTVALYCLFFKGIRIGEKKATKNGTKGLLSIEYGKEVVGIESVQTLKFDFLGKDSVRDLSVLKVDDPEVYFNICKVWNKVKTLGSATTKEEIKAWVKNNSKTPISFTPKLSRTFVAAKVMLDALKAVEVKYNLTENSPEGFKKLAFQEANMAVAHQLNHQRGVSKAAEEKRKANFAETKENLKKREQKTKELIKKRKDRIKKLKAEKKDGWKDKVAKLEEMIAKSEMRNDLAGKNAAFKEKEANFTATTSKGAYIDPTIIADWCEKIKLPLEKVYSKTQMNQFENYFNK